MFRCSQPLFRSQSPHPTTKQGDNTTCCLRTQQCASVSILMTVRRFADYPSTGWTGFTKHIHQVDIHYRCLLYVPSSFDWEMVLLRKEVIQPHLPVRLPCYDFVPIADPTFDSSLQKVRPLASGVTDFHDVTGGVYKARERIHRSVADLRLLATPTSWGRVADPNPN